MQVWYVTVDSIDQRGIHFVRETPLSLKYALAKLF